MGGPGATPVIWSRASSGGASGDVNKATRDVSAFHTAAHSSKHDYKGGPAVVNRQFPPISDIPRRIEQNFAIAVILGARRLGGIDATESDFQEHH